MISDACRIVLLRYTKNTKVTKYEASNQPQNPSKRKKSNLSLKNFP